jgi:phosphoribosylformylglycinamidine cyclo-ligase
MNDRPPQEASTEPTTPRSAEGTLSYRDAGVDIDAGDAVVDRLRKMSTGVRDPRVARGLGHFGGFFRIGATPSNTTLVASIDGVGTKLVVASLAGKHDGIGADIVHHCINDIVACGAEPLFFLDYFGTGKLNPDAALVVIGGIARACEAAGVALIGGETAEMPGLYSGDDYDVVGAIVGILQEDRIIDGTSIQHGDAIVGIPSSGFHTNGYSLVRAALGLNESAASRQRLQQPAPFDETMSLAEALLEPHRLYRQNVERALATGAVRGMAHITGGGIPGNLARVIPDGLTAVIDAGRWQVPALFDYVAEAGNIARSECWRAFNMGIGFIMVVDPAQVDEITGAVPDAERIGHVEAGTHEKVVINDDCD